MSLQCPRCKSREVSKRLLSCEDVPSYRIPSRSWGRVTGAYLLECMSCGKSAKALRLKERC